MAIRRCPQCKTTSDDMYGFCIQCGYEFPNAANMKKVCIKCGFENNEEAECCVKCGTPLNINTVEDMLKNMNIIMEPSVKNKMVITPNPQNYKPTSKILIIFGYIFSLLMPIIGLIIGIYLLTGKDPVAKKHGILQIFLATINIVITLLLYIFGYIDMNSLITKYNNMTGLM